MKKNKIKQLGVMLSLIILSNNDINPEELDNILGTSHYIYQEIDNPEYGDTLIHAFISLPTYVKKFLADNSLEIIVSGNSDYVESIYRNLYPDIEITDKAGVTIDYAGKLIAAVEGCSFDGDSKVFIKNKNISKEELIEINLTLLMYHQVGHLIDRYFNNLSESSYFLGCFSQEGYQFRFQVASFVGFYDENMNIYEYFATTFACYLKYPEYFKSVCPMTYNFFNKYIKGQLIDKTNQK